MRKLSNRFSLLAAAILALVSLVAASVPKTAYAETWETVLLTNNARVEMTTDKMKIRGYFTNMIRGGVPYGQLGAWFRVTLGNQNYYLHCISPNNVAPAQGATLYFYGTYAYQSGGYRYYDIYTAQTSNVNWEEWYSIVNNYGIYLYTTSQVLAGQIWVKPIEYGDLTVKKTVRNATSAASGKSFDFTINVRDSGGMGISGSYRYVGGGGKQNGSLSFSGGKAYVSLKDGESITLKDLPGGGSYSVSETTKAGFIQGGSGFSGTIKPNATATASITNTYEAVGFWTPSPIVKKIIGQRSILSNDFAFTLRKDSANGQIIETIATPEARSSAADNSVSTEAMTFSPIKYTLADVGKTYTYVVTEKLTDKAGYTYDAHQLVYKVTVVDNGTGTLTTSVETSGARTFTNTYHASGSASFSARKELTGRKLQANEFAFALRKGSPTGEIVATASNNGTGEIAFTDQMFDENDIDNVITYYITEEAGSEDGVIYDDSAFRVDVHVKDNRNGTLTCTKTTDGSDFTFSNSLEPSNILVSKVGVSVTPVSARSEFTFDISLKDKYGNPLPGYYPYESVSAPNGDPHYGTVHDGGSFKVGVGEQIRIKGLPHGTQYAIQERDGIVKGFTAIPEDTVGNEGSTSYHDDSDVSFSNRYSASGSTEIVAFKRLPGGTVEGGDFSFNLYSDAACTNQIGETMEIADDASVRFPYSFTEADHGQEIYVYMKENAGTDTNMEYSSSVLCFKIEPQDNGDGTMGSTVTAVDPSTKQPLDSEPSFTNRYKPGNLAVRKIVSGTSDDTFTFKVSLSNPYGYPLDVNEIANNINIVSNTGTRNNLMAQSRVTAVPLDSEIDEASLLEDNSATAVIDENEDEIPSDDQSDDGNQTDVPVDAVPDDIIVGSEETDDIPTVSDDVEATPASTDEEMEENRQAEDITIPIMEQSEENDTQILEVIKTEGTSATGSASFTKPKYRISLSSSYTDPPTNWTDNTSGWISSGSETSVSIGNRKPGAIRMAYDGGSVSGTLTISVPDTTVNPQQIGSSWTNITYWFGNISSTRWLGYKNGTFKITMTGNLNNWYTASGSVGYSNSTGSARFKLTPKSWGITYNLNGGSISGQKTSYTVEDRFTLPTPTRTGYTFTGWTGTGLNSAAKTVTVGYGDSGARSYTANWSINTYTVSYNANGGSNAPGNQTKTYGTNLTLTSNKPTRTGYTFDGWNTQSDGKGTNYASGGTYSANAAVTLYAKWKPNTYTIKYSLGGGSMVNPYNDVFNRTTDNYTFIRNPTTMTYDNLGYTVPSGRLRNGYFYVDVPTRTGYQFKGWNITGMDSTTHNFWYNGQANPTTATSLNTATLPTLSPLSNNLRATSGTVTYTAQWTANTYKVAFNANGGTGSMANQTMTYGTASNLTARSFYRFNYVFTGWNTKANGTGTAYADKQSVNNLTATNNGTVTLYAQWSPVNNVSVSGGEIYITIPANATATLPNIPYGTSYTVEELVKPGWQTSTTSGLGGVIESNTTKTASVTNAKTTGTSWKIKVPVKAYKLLDGQPAGGFRFQLLNSSNTVISTATNGADGFMTWTPEFTADGTYTFYIKEVAGTDSTMTYDSHTETVTVKISNNGQTKSVTYSSGNQSYAVFRNTRPTAARTIRKTISHACAETTFTFYVSATYNGMPIADGQYGDVAIENGVGTATVNIANATEGQDASADIELTGLPAGTRVIVREINIPDGWSAENASWSENVAAGSSDTIVFRNNYDTQPAEVTAVPVVTKTLTNRELSEGMFDFEVLDEGGQVISKGANAADGSISFDPIRFSAIGTYTYTIREVEGTDDSIEYDTAERKVRFTVVPGEGGKLAVEEPELIDGEPIIENKAKTGIIRLTKHVVEASKAYAGEFSFVINITPPADSTMTGYPTSRGDAIQSGDTITLSDGESIDIEVPHGAAYTITELNVLPAAPTPTENLPAWVTDTPTQSGTARYDSISSVSFVNELKQTPPKTEPPHPTLPGGVFELGVKKIAENFDLAGTAFEFELIDAETEAVLDRVESDGNGDAAFMIFFDDDDIGTTKNYIVRETPGTDTTMDYDTRNIPVSVTITSEGNGLKYAVSTSEPNDEIIFRNAKKSGSLAISKTVEGVPNGSPASTASFEFTITLHNENEATVSGVYHTSDNGTVEFTDGIATLSLHDGERVEILGIPVGYRYEVQESNIPQGFTLSDMEDAAGIIGDGVSAEASFANLYAARGATLVSATKKTYETDGVTERDTPNAAFAFSLSGNGETLYARNNGLGQVAFPELHFTEPGTYTYQIKEIHPNDADAAIAEASTAVVASNTTMTVSWFDDSADHSAVIAAAGLSGNPSAEETYLALADNDAANGTDILSEYVSYFNRELSASSSGIEWADQSADHSAAIAAAGLEAGATAEEVYQGLMIADLIDGGHTSQTYAGMFSITGQTMSPKLDAEKYNWDYDTHTETVTIEVIDNGDGTLTATPSYDADGAVFSNTFATIPVTGIGDDRQANILAIAATAALVPLFLVAFRRVARELR